MMKAQSIGDGTEWSAVSEVSSALMFCRLFFLYARARNLLSHSPVSLSRSLSLSPPPTTKANSIGDGTAWTAVSEVRFKCVG